MRNEELRIVEEVRSHGFAMVWVKTPQRGVSTTQTDEPVTIWVAGSRKRRVSRFLELRVEGSHRNAADARPRKYSEEPARPYLSCVEPHNNCSEPPWAALSRIEPHKTAYE
jgi:hypothetical protein